MARTYKTSSGTFSEHELVIAIWTNPKKAKARPNARPLETLTAEKNPYPIAFPLEMLQKIQSWMYCQVASSQDDIDGVLLRGLATRERPLLVPVPLAKHYLGWEEFYVPTEYKDLK